MKFGKNSGINRGRTRSVMNVLISELLHQVPGAHGSTCAFLVLRKTIIHDKSHFVLSSSSTMDDRNELISRDNSRILQLFQQITFRREYTAIQGAKKTQARERRSGSATPFRACGWYGAVKRASARAMLGRLLYALDYLMAFVPTSVLPE